MFSIELLLLLGGLPESDEVVVLSFFVFSHFENDGIQLLPHPADRPVLFGPIRALAKVVWVRKNFLRLFESECLFSGLLLTARSSAHQGTVSFEDVFLRCVGKEPLHQSVLVFNGRRRWTGYIPSGPQWHCRSASQPVLRVELRGALLCFQYQLFQLLLGPCSFRIHARRCLSSLHSALSVSMSDFRFACWSVLYTLQ